MLTPLPENGLSVLEGGAKLNGMGAQLDYICNDEVLATEFVTIEAGESEDVLRAKVETQIVAWFLEPPVPPWDQN
jgi:hypothetical protein